MEVEGKRKRKITCDKLDNIEDYHVMKSGECQTSGDDICHQHTHRCVSTSCYIFELGVHTNR